ncbi:hypothetical protein GH714_018198 [Hevea brasiliensis]|uniref:Uncharacterized protein n=1 Tax=Hevea brasiliensis TaxID=3981 RepID=A0A6A6MNC2_HEVBR|nr:hypothetical protein GH714_018198 [Hevea brasiliensis]
MAPSQLDRLARIGREGFALIDECYGRTNASDRSGISRIQNNYHSHSQYQQPLVYHGPQISTVRVPVVTSNYEIAQHYYTGMAAGEPVITSDKAAENYDGFSIVEHVTIFAFFSKLNQQLYMDKVLDEIG